MDDPLYDDEIDLYSGPPIATVPASKTPPPDKGKPTTAYTRSTFSAWFSRLSLPEVVGLGLASGLLLASPLLLLTPGSGVIRSLEAITLIFSLPVLWWTRHRLPWDVLFRLAMSLTFLGGDLVLAGYMTEQGALVDWLCVIPQGIAAMLAWLGFGVRYGRRQAVTEGLGVLFVGSIGNTGAMLMVSLVFRAAAGPLAVSGLVSSLIGCVYGVRAIRAVKVRRPDAFVRLTRRCDRKGEILPWTS